MPYNPERKITLHQDSDGLCPFRIVLSIAAGVVETSRTMLLYFLRHGDAVNGTDDATRLLSPEGKQQAARIGAFLKKVRVHLEAVYSSPLVRAAQTAEIASGTCNGHAKVKVQMAAGLLNETSQTEFNGWLKGLPEVKHGLLVGHMPSLSERVAHLLRMSGPDALSFPKCGLVCLETANRREATLRFFVSPEVI